MKHFLNIRSAAKLVFIAVVVLPFVSGMIYALLYSLGLIGVLNKGFTLNIWKDVLASEIFWASFFYSLYIAVVSIFLSVSVALACVAFWQRQLEKGLLSRMIYAPLCIPGTVMAFFSYQMLTKSGFISRVGHQTGAIKDLAHFPDLVNDAWGFGIIGTFVLLSAPFFIILFSGIYKNEHLHHYKLLAQNMGASSKQIFKRITLPILLNRAYVTIFVFVIFVMGSYEVPLLLGRQYPQMISVSIVQKIQKYNLYDIPQGYAMSVLYVLVVLGFLWLLFFKLISAHKYRKAHV